MNKPKDYTLLAVGLVLLLAVLIASCNHKEPIHKNESHTCRWPLCPYKGITNDKAAKAVANYVGDSGINAYYIDMLHIQYPTYEYDQLDSLLTH